MASETVVSTQTPPTVEELKEKLDEEEEEVRPTKHESDSPPKECEDQNPKPEELPSVEPPLAKQEEKTVHSLNEEPPASVTTLYDEAKDKTGDESTVAPVVEEVVKTEDIPFKDNLAVAQYLIHEPDMSSVPEVVDDGVKTQPEEQPANESVDREPQEQPAIETTDIKQEEQPSTESFVKEPEEQPETDSITKHPDEQPNIVHVPISLIEAMEKPEEPLKVSPIEESEYVTGKEMEVSEAESIKEDTPEPAVPEMKEKSKPTTVAEVEAKPESTVHKVEEKPEPAVTEMEVKPEPTVPEVEEKLEDAAVPEVEEKHEPAITEMEGKLEPTVPEVEEIPNSTVPKVEEKPKPAVPEVKEKVEDAAVPEVEEKPGPQPIAEEIEKFEEVEPNGSVPGETEKQEVDFPDKVEDIAIVKEENSSKDQEVLASESSDQVVSINQEAQVDPKGDEGNCTPSEKVVEESIKKEASVASVVEEVSKEAVVELAKVEPIKAEDVNNAVCTAEVTTTLVEGETKSRDVELLPENKKDDIKDEIPASVDANKEEAEEKLSENTTAFNKLVVDPQESELKVKEKETEADKQEKETVKSDGYDTKISEDLPKQVPVKPTQKQSNNILTKVKKSLVKAKKAILGKSPTSKTITAETKGDIEVE